MSTSTPIIILFVALFFASCSSDTRATKAAFQLPLPGTVIDSASMPVTEDKLNDFRFSVVLSADSDVKGGVYDVRAAYGYDVANGAFTMPKGLEKYKLVLRKGTNPYTYVVGFKVPKDTTFYEYFEISGKKGAIGMQYLKAYIFQ